MKVYAYQTSDDQVIYVRDGAIVLCSFIDESESIEWGIERVCGAELVNIEGEAATQVIEDGLDSENLACITASVQALLIERIVKWIEEHDL